jgi:hypothetical protein
MIDGKSEEFPAVAVNRPARKRWTTPRVILAELRQTNEPGALSTPYFDHKGPQTEFGS